MSGTLVINGCKCLKKGVKGPDGKYCPVWYSYGSISVQDGNGGSIKNAVTVYARCILKDLPRALGRVENNTEIQSDYFETDRVRFFEGSPEFAALLPLCQNR